MKFTVTIELEHLSGLTQDEETMIDCFAANVGRQNTAKEPLTLRVPDEHGGPEFGGTESVYEVRIVDVPS